MTNVQRITDRPAVRHDPAARIVAVTFSAGGIRPLLQFFGRVPANLPAAVVITHHTGDVSCLPDVVQNQSAVTVKFAEHGEVVREAAAYICPPRHHLVVNPDATLCLSSHPRINLMRPSADWFLRSVAGTFGDRAIAVVLSGAANDGVAGVGCVLESGGLVLVQSPESALYPALPRAVLKAHPGCVSESPESMANRVVGMLAAQDASGVRAEWEHPFGPERAA